MMKSLKNLLDKKIGGQKTPGSTVLNDKDVFYIFNKIIQAEFGNVGQAKLKPDFFGRQILHVKCGSPAWASELWLNKNILIRKINKELGEDAIKDIKTK